MSVLTASTSVAPVTPPPHAPTASPYPRVKRLTVSEFHEVRSTGIWDGQRTYLIRGVIWEQGPMKPPHAALVGIVEDALSIAFGPGYCCRSQVPLVLGLDSDPFPDVAVLTGTLRDYLTVHPTSAHLVVEIAETSMFEDQTTKAELYASAGIAEYWIVDVNDRKLHVYRDPKAIPDGGTAYRNTFPLTVTDSISPLAVPTATIRVADLLP